MTDEQHVRPANEKHVTIVGLGGEGFRAICSCGWRSGTSWDRATVVRERDDHKWQTHLRSAP